MKSILPVGRAAVLLVATLVGACTLRANILDVRPTAVARATVPATNTPQPTETAPARPSATRASGVLATVPAGQRATVVDIIDGDTIDVELDGEVRRLRYIGMDTPERGEPFYEEAAEANRRLVQGRQVILVRDVSETDRFGRLLRYVYLEDGAFVNGELVALGYAVAATFPPDVAQQALLFRLQREAWQRGAGLWAEAAIATRPPPEPGVARVVIAFIYYHGVDGRNEPDEYAVIANEGDAPVNLAGWRLNAGAPGQDFVFPSFDLQPGQSCRVYTNQVDPDSCGFSFGSGQAVWRNSGDCGYLFDAAGAQVWEHCY